MVNMSAPALQWTNRDLDVYYYEVQVSGDSSFDVSPDTATSFVWWNLVHGGVTSPPNSWQSPELEPNSQYFWRVRPRVQGDGTPVGWGPAWRFSTAASLVNPDPTPTPVATATPTLPAATPTPAPTATPAAPQSRLAFVSSRDGNYEIYRGNADGSGVMRLTNDPQVDDRPTWSPNGRKIAYESTRGGNKQIYVMNADGSDVIQLTTDSARNEHPAWSPDGGRIAFVSNGQVNIMLADGSDRRALTATLNDAERPAWLPSGGEIAYISGRQGAEGRQLCQISMTGIGKQCAGGIAKVNGSFHWSSRVDRYAWTCDAEHMEQICLSGQWLRTGVANVARGHSPNWAPDAQKLAFVSNRDGTQQISIINWDGTGESRLTSHKSENFNPIWSPDGTKIAFVSDRDGGRDIFVMNADGTGTVNVTNNVAYDALPVWSPPIADAPAVSGKLSPTRTLTADSAASMPPMAGGRRSE